MSYGQPPATHTGEAFIQVSDNYKALSWEACEAQAQARGQVAVVPKENELFIDIDNLHSLERFYKALVALSRNDNDAFDVTIRSSKSGGVHFHIVVTLRRDVSTLERIALQAALGSDPVREIISLARIRAGNPNPTVFFEEK